MAKLEVLERPSITLILPTLNEVAGLKACIDAVDFSIFERVLVVDGGSIDGTIELAQKHNIDVYYQTRPGLGYGIFDAIREVVRTDYVIEFSPDNNCLPEKLPPLAEKLRSGEDVVVVSRYLPPAVSYDDTPITKLGNWGFSRLFRLLGDRSVTDVLNIFRGYRTEIVHNPLFEKLLVGPVFEPLVTVMASLYKLRYSEIPGDEPKRVDGHSKMSVTYNGSCILWLWIRSVLIKFVPFLLPRRRIAS